MQVRTLGRKSERRMAVEYLQSLGIQSYGDDNLYPETLRRIIHGSATGTECVERMAEFIEGNGMKDQALASASVNHHGDTMDDVIHQLALDIAYYNGIAIHVNYNVDGAITELQHIPFENCRLVEPDSWGYVAKIAVHPDWTGRKSFAGERQMVNKENIDFIDVFNPDKEVVLHQIADAGGIEHYKGQVLWCSLAGRGQYPLGTADRCATEMSTDEGLSNVKFRNARNNFLPAGMIVTKRGSTSSIMEDEGLDEEAAEERLRRQREDFHSSLASLQGDANVGKFLEVTIDEDEEKPEFVPFVTNNYDKEFKVTEDSVTSRIYSSFGQEAFYCIKSGKVGFSVDIVSASFAYYNSSVSKYQRFISRAVQNVFNKWYIPVSFTDYSIKPMEYIANEKPVTR